MAEKLTPKKFLRAHLRDAVVILSLVILVAAVTLVFALTRKAGDTVKVEIDGEEVARYSLTEDGEYPIGEGNVLVIEGGEAYMKDADCPDRTCVRTGKISHGGETIVCLPNRVAVTVISADGGTDLVS